MPDKLVAILFMHQGLGLIKHTLKYLTSWYKIIFYALNSDPNVLSKNVISDQMPAKGVILLTQELF